MYMNKITELKTKYHLNRKQMSELTGIPARTLKSWELEEREAPDYMYNLIENTLKNNVLVKESKAYLTPHIEVVNDARLNAVLKKDPDVLTKEEKALVANAYIFQMNNEWAKKDRGGIYGYTQRHMAYNSSKMEGNQLTEDDTATLFETDQLPQGDYRPKDIEEMSGHFLMFNKALATINEPLTEDLIKQLHFELQAGVFEFRANGYVPGAYKSKVNAVSNIETSRPDEVAKDMAALLNEYKNDWDMPFVDKTALFHSRYEKIHPFQDGNGRTGRMIMFRECLVNEELPIVIRDEFKADYRSALNKSQTQGLREDLVSFLTKEQCAFYEVLQKYMYDHSIALEPECEDDRADDL